MAGQKGSIEFKFSRKDHYLVTLNRDWPNLKATVKKRHDLAGRILGELYARLPKEHASSQAEVRVQFSLKEIAGRMHRVGQGSRQPSALRSNVACCSCTNKTSLSCSTVWRCSAKP